MFSNQALKKLIVPLLIEQLLSVLVGMADIMMVSSVEEAAVIDGCNILQLFFRVVFPLLKSTTVTVIILNAMWIWNDYLLPFLVIGNSDFKTLTLEIYYAKMLSGQYGNPWELIFPAVLVSIIPIIIVFLSLQKYFVKGVSDGAVKM